MFNMGDAPRFCSQIAELQWTAVAGGICRGPVETAEDVVAFGIQNFAACQTSPAKSI